MHSFDKIVLEEEVWHDGQRGLDAHSHKAIVFWQEICNRSLSGIVIVNLDKMTRMNPITSKISAGQDSCVHNISTSRKYGFMVVVPYHKTETCFFHLQTQGSILINAKYPFLMGFCAANFLLRCVRFPLLFISLFMLLAN